MNTQTEIMKLKYLLLQPQLFLPMLFNINLLLYVGLC